MLTCCPAPSTSSSSSESLSEPPLLQSHSLLIIILPYFPPSLNHARKVLFAQPCEGTCVRPSLLVSILQHH